MHPSHQEYLLVINCENFSYVDVPPTAMLSDMAGILGKHIFHYSIY
jgi:hypothetical protein